MDEVQLRAAESHVDLVTSDFTIRFKSTDAFVRFREWIETARIVGGEGRPVQTPLSDDEWEEWYVLAQGNGVVSLEYFSPGDVDLSFVMSEERWRDIGHVVLGSSAQIP